ncbi:probable inactive tRNA-specific adenosine deaminase-like protein 3 isoform X1 [Ananas comosus]|uniref:Probable inactive tRNA-specific adenosine deaminase-like protein 3 isoform X1 n=1 Tax=Ananas comosus TaxID=4615 RepID=A0A6P5GCQ1_ANACO|nr:probable inactive tRNA-specific adenosine deaminase-like protein 3 isoform X1 [Ananas comosus]
MSWEILHIPGKPPSSLEHSTVNAVAATIEPKLANTLVRQLNQICPLEDLRHVKRVRRINSEGKVELSVILCISRENENVLEVVPSDVLEVVNTYQLRPFTVKVAKYAAMSKEEWEEQCKLWPTSYHPPNNLDRVSGFSVEDSQSICNYMKIAIQLTRLSNPSDKVVNAAVIVDSSSSEIIAKATDQTGLPPTSLLKICSNHLTVAGEAHSASSMAEENGLAKQEALCPPRNWLSPCTHSLKGVACLNPRGWIEQRPYDQKLVNCGSNFSWHPLKHATLVAIENAAARDRKLFPNLGSLVNNRDLNGGLENDSNNGPAKRLKTDKLEDRGRLGEEACSSDSSSEAMRPYLCTGFDIYLVWEPCTMCAMALVHQRIRRVFYASPNPNGGALDSVHRLHGEKSLNHHYSVYRILIPENALHELCFNEPCNNSSPQQQM